MSRHSFYKNAVRLCVTDCDVQFLLAFVLPLGIFYYSYLLAYFFHVILCSSLSFSVFIVIDFVYNWVRWPVDDLLNTNTNTNTNNRTKNARLRVGVLTRSHGNGIMPTKRVITHKMGYTVASTRCLMPSERRVMLMLQDLLRIHNKTAAAADAIPFVCKMHCVHFFIVC